MQGPGSMPGMPGMGMGTQDMHAPLMASAPPLDYSFKELRVCAELETEEPRSGNKRVAPEPIREPGGGGEPGEELEGAAVAATSSVAGAELAGGASTRPLQRTGAPTKRVLNKVTTTVKLNNNMLESLSGLAPSLEIVMVSPLANLQWIDISFNQLVTVDRELEMFQNLKALYLHGNCIQRIGSVDRMRKLPKLLSLTLNGNPIESIKSYRSYIVGVLPSLRSLDHSTITPDEVSSAMAWYKGYQDRAKKRAEERQFAGEEDG